MIIEYANKDDLTNIVHLNVREYWEDTSEWDQANKYERWKRAIWWADQSLLEWYYSILRHCDGGIIITQVNGQVIGQLDFVKSHDNIVDFDDDRLHIIWILTDPEYRRQGIAQKMIEFLLNDTDLPVWVEPEDDRSQSLYEKVGYKRYNISNWSLAFSEVSEQIYDQRKEAEQLSMKTLTNLENDFQLLLGRYYAPCYDLYQLLRSDPVGDFMWGNTEFPDVHYYLVGNTSVYAIMTQYPRIWVNLNYDLQELQEILATICLQIFEMGFDTIYFQIYNESDIGMILSSLGFTKYIDNDPVYQLNPL